MIRAIQARLECDPSAQRVSARVFAEYRVGLDDPFLSRWQIPNLFTDLFRRAEQRIEGRGKLQSAILRELQAWQALLPEIVTVAKAQQADGDVPNGQKQSEPYPF